MSLVRWLTVRAKELDEIEAAHRAVGGHGRGRRFATQRVNHAYAVLVASQFQGFCRDLHSESLDHLVTAVSPVTWQSGLRAEFVLNRKLDFGNPSPGNVGSDFSRLGIAFWNHVKATDRRNERRCRALEELNVWRNAIAHQDFDPLKLKGKITLTLAQVRAWRGVCDELAQAFDTVMRDFITSVVGKPPW